jgi:trk system potassium uptake protein TrkH
MPTFTKHLSPYVLVLLSFLSVILLGTILLALPWSHQDGLWGDWIDSLFLATSATAVTGLSPYQAIAQELTIFGQIIVLLLISIGGLGLITIFTFIIILTGRRIGLFDRYVLKEVLNLASMEGAVKFVKRIVLITLIVEGLGMIPYMFVFVPEFGWVEGTYQALFLSVSAFNNAGLDILGSTSLQAYVDNPLINMNTVILIFLGGLGFLVINDIFFDHREEDKKDYFTIKKPEKWSVYSKIVILTSISLIVLGAVMIYVIELGHSNGELSFMAAFFQSVSSRTAGLATIDLNNLSFAGKLILMGLMFIGANPISTGGGIKTTTAFLIFMAIFGFFRQEKPHAFRRSFSADSLLRSFIIFVLSIVIILVATLVVERFEAGQPTSNPIPYLFEVISAYGTVGFSLGITPSLSIGSQLVLSLVMLIGRIGPLTAFAAFTDSLKKESTVEYIEEYVPIG